MDRFILCSSTVAKIFIRNRFSLGNWTNVIDQNRSKVNDNTSVLLETQTTNKLWSERMEDFSPLEGILRGPPQTVILNKKINNYNCIKRCTILWMQFVTFNDRSLHTPTKMPHLKESNNLSTLSVKINVIETRPSRKAWDSRHLRKMRNISFTWYRSHYYCRFYIITNYTWNEWIYK